LVRHQHKKEIERQVKKIWTKEETVITQQMGRLTNGQRDATVNIRNERIHVN
jgi:hypothetical protein